MRVPDRCPVFFYTFMRSFLRQDDSRSCNYERNSVNNPLIINLRFFLRQDDKAIRVILNAACGVKNLNTLSRSFLRQVDKAICVILNAAQRSEESLCKITMGNLNFTETILSVTFFHNVKGVLIYVMVTSQDYRN